MRLKPALGLLILAAGTLIACAGGMGKSAAPSGPGALTLTEQFHDFGKVTEGDIIHHRFPFKNTGQGIFRITKTETSCGCTTAQGALKAYLPGEEGTLDITIDTKGKHGVIMKTVTLFLSNATEKTSEISLMAELIPPPHPMVERGTVITKDPRCKSCHLDSGVGQEGVFLYHRVCGQCHGKKGIGASAMALNNSDWLKTIGDNRFREVIKDGIPEKDMPPLVTGVSPPLTEQQVESLIVYIRSLGEQ